MDILITKKRLINILGSLSALSILIRKLIPDTQKREFQCQCVSVDVVIENANSKCKCK
jgi:hypothetical protein